MDIDPDGYFGPGQRVHVPLILLFPDPETEELFLFFVQARVTSNDIRDVSYKASNLLTLCAAYEQVKYAAGSLFHELVLVLVCVPKYHTPSVIVVK